MTGLMGKLLKNPVFRDFFFFSSLIFGLGESAGAAAARHRGTAPALPRTAERSPGDARPSAPVPATPGALHLPAETTRARASPAALHLFSAREAPPPRAGLQAGDPQGGQRGLS